MLAWASSHLPPVTLAASLVRYEYDSGEEISRAITTHLFQAGTTKTLLLHISFDQTSENKLELELNFKKKKTFVIQQNFRLFLFLSLLHLNRLSFVRLSLCRLRINLKLILNTRSSSTSTKLCFLWRFMFESSTLKSLKYYARNFFWRGRVDT